MKLSMWFLSVLLALGSATLQDIQGNRSQTTEGLEDTVEPPSNRSLLVLLTPAELQGNRTGRSSVRYQSSTLTWQTYNGYVPSGAYSTFISYTGRADYVCKHGCSSGLFNPSFGPYCYYPLGGREHSATYFQLLVNEGNFEILEWKADSWGGVPQHSVQTCYGDDLYVGKNKYGLGKVHTKHRAFFLPWRGSEYSYNTYYEVLTVNKNYYSEQMSNVNYDLDVTVTEHPPQAIQQSTIVNNECSPVEKTAELSETFQEEKRWDTTTSVTLLTSITTSIPIIGSEITLGLETTHSFSRGTTVVESKTYSVSIQQTVPPNHSCKITMIGRKYQADIPYTAMLSRKYNNGQTRVRSITGTFRGVNMGGIHAVVERCKPVPNPSPCPTTET